MGSSSEKRAHALSVALAVLAIAALSLFLARFATHLYSFGSDATRALGPAISTLGPALLSDPFGIDFSRPAVRTWALSGVLIPLGMWLLVKGRGMRLDNEDTQHAHGDDRLATEREARALADWDVYENNIWYSENCGIARIGRDKKTKATLDGRNLNCITLGISGLGKTYNLVWPNLMQAIGSGLPPKPYGLRNVPARLGLPAPSLPHRRPKMAESAASAIDAGFDVFCTDPKGDNVRDLGQMFVDAGYDLKVVNTIDFADGVHVNPLAYIKTHAVATKPADSVECSVTAEGPVGTEADAPFATFTFDNPITTREGRSHGNELWHVRAELSLDTARVGLEGVSAGSMSASELDAAIAAAEPGSPELDELVAQRDMLWIETDMGSYIESDSQVAGSGCRKVAETLKTFSATSVSGTFAVEFKNLTANPINADVTIELDPALVVDDVVCTNGWQEWSRDPDTGQRTQAGPVVWHLERTRPKRNAPGGELVVPERLEFKVHVRATQVPDGVDLAKTVECLVANLRGTDAKSNGSEDPFWEDTKRLCFMSLIAFLFERYPAKYHTIPEMMRLLNMALADSGDPTEKSPLAVVMEMWEYGRVFDPGGGPQAAEGMRGKAPTSSWKKADNLPHSRNDSIALHCYHAFTSGAPETVQSVIISCQAALVKLVTDDVKEFLAYDELELDRLGDPDSKRAIFCVIKDTDSPFDFITALIIYLAIDLAQDKAYKRYGGKLPRHLRFELDEVANIGKIPILVRALAVVRSRNISISMYLQSKAQLAMVYGEKEADVIFDNCSTILFLGAQTESTLEEMSKRVGTETVHSRTFQRSFSGITSSSSSESISSNERRVRSASQLSRMEKGWMMVFIFNARPIYDHKFKTRQHPYYAYINPADERGWLEPRPVYERRFDYREYRRSLMKGVEDMASGG